MSRTQGYAVVGWGAAIPDSTLASGHLENRLGLETGWIKQRTGVETRPIAGESVATSDLAVRAGGQALVHAGVPKEAIGLVILATSTPDYPLPPTAPSVAGLLGLANSGAIDLAGACSGFLYGLAFADSFCRTHKTCALVIGANVLSKRLNWRDPMTAGLFADGAGAVVWAPVPRPDAGILGVKLSSQACNHAQVRVSHGGSRNPFGPQTYASGKHLMEMAEGPLLFKKAVTAMATAGEAALADAGLNIDAIDYWIPHQANQRLVQHTRRKLGVAREKTLIEIASLGNASAASIPLVWARHVHRNPPAPGQKWLFTAVGAGLISAGIVLQH